MKQTCSIICIPEQYIFWEVELDIYNNYIYIIIDVYRCLFLV